MLPDKPTQTKGENKPLEKLFRRDLLVNANGNTAMGVSPNYHFLSLLNPTAWSLRVYVGKSTDLTDQIGFCSTFTIITIPLPENCQEITISYMWAGSGAATADKFTLVFSVENLGANLSLRTPAGATLVDVVGNTAGLAEQATLVKGIPLVKANSFNVAAPGVNTNILAVSLTPTNSPATFRIDVTLAVASVFKARLTQGATTFDRKFNAGVALVAGGAYMFDVLVHTGDTVNFQVETDGVIQVLKVVELGGTA